MAKQLSYLSLDDIGLNGLNVQSNPASLDPSWLTSAENIVLRESGRISFRKGLKQNVLSTTAKIGVIGETQGGTILAAVGTNMYTVDFTAPDAPWTAVHAVVGGSDSDWQMIPFKGEMYCTQVGHELLEYDSGTWLPISSTTGYVAPSATTFDPNCGSAYYGRLWVGGVTEAKGTVYYSDTLNAHKWASGAAGEIDLTTVWGNDEIVAIAPFYGKMVFFGKHNIAIYNNPTTPTSMTLDEVIRDVGCVSRDSVQAVGDDLLFLSDTGLRSLHRTSELDKVPLTDYSVAIKDTLVRNIGQSTNVKAVYVRSEGVYLLSFVDLNITYVFDMKHFAPTKSPRLTVWKFDGDREPSCLAYTDTKGFLAGQKSGSIATYEGYFDKVYISGGTYTSHSYTGVFSTTWLDLGQSVTAALLKKLKAVISGGQGTVVSVKWFKDFSNEPSTTQNFLLNPTISSAPSLWGGTGVLYGQAKYAPSYGLKEYNVPLGGSAKFLKLEMTAETKGYVASLQDMSLLFKQGKIR